MKIRPLLFVPLLLLPSSCNKLKDLAEKAKSSGSAAATSASSSGVADVRELDPKDFDTFVTTPGQLVVVDYHAEWCGPCKQLGPVLEQVAGEFSGRVRIGKIDVDHAHELAKREGVSSIPDVRLYRDGRLVDKFVGSADAATIRDLFENHTLGLEPAVLESPGPGPDGGSGGAPAIQPMKKDWLPPGMEKR